MPSAAEGGNGAAKPFGGIKIASLLQLAAINRENERSNATSTSSKAAPLTEVLNEPDANRRLVPLSLIAPQQHDVEASSLASLLNVLDPKIIALSEPLQSAATNAHEPSHAAPQVRLPGVEDITKRPPKHGKAGVPLAEVLNDESRSPHLSVVQPSSRRASISSAGGRKRRRLSNIVDLAATSQVEGPGKEDSDTRSGRKYAGQGITLPRPPDTNPREKRQGLPPVITGLHDPPEETRLIPSISTGDDVWQSLQNPKPTHEIAYKGAARPVEGLQIEPTTDNVHTRDRSPSPIEADGSSGRDEVNDEPEEENDHPAVATPSKGVRKVKGYRRWTKEEGEHLLQGVKKYGIGNWKRILEHPDFHFHPGRSAVDLKDRFRRCFPEQYQKAGKSALHERQNATHDTGQQGTVDLKHSTRRDGDTARNAEGQEIDVAETTDAHEQPDSAQFKRATRRGRVRFSEQEDDALERGFQRHGPNWQKILVDAELKDILAGRKRTDLRDRFRNKWPDKFKTAKARNPSAIQDHDPSIDPGDNKGAGLGSTTVSEKPTSPVNPKSRLEAEVQFSTTASAAPLQVAAIPGDTTVPHFVSQQLSGVLPPMLFDDLDLNDADIGFDSVPAAPILALDRLMLDRDERGAQDRGLVSVPPTNGPVLTTVLNNDFQDLHNDTQPAIDSSPSGNVATTTGPTGMPLSSMLASDNGGRDLIGNSSSIVYNSAVERGHVLPDSEELSAPFEQDIRSEPSW